MEIALILSILAMVTVHTISLLSLLAMDKNKGNHNTPMECRGADRANENKDLKVK